jgi:hypothetical protein
MNQDYKDFLRRTESPCVDCPNRVGMRCTFYGVDLEFEHNYIAPSDQCEEDCEEGEPT